MQEFFAKHSGSNFHYISPYPNKLMCDDDDILKRQNPIHYLNSMAHWVTYLIKCG